MDMSGNDESAKGGGVSAGLLMALAAAICLVAWFYYLLAPGRVKVEPPTMMFRDVAPEAGIDFVHNNGATEEELLPETMGSGVAVFDFDRDGWQDLLFMNSTYWPWENASEAESTTPALYRNRGDGTFEDVTDDSGLAVSLFGMGVATGDYDNDGWPDVFMTAVGGNRLFRNAGAGQFVEVTREGGVGGESNEWSASAAWVDLNNDGLLDLFVCNYVRWAKELGIELAFKLAGIGRGYAPQVNFTGAYSDLYLNNGDGTYSDVSRISGIEVLDEETGFPLGRSLAVAPIDLDLDGLLDLVVANHNMPHFVFRNLGNGRFEEIGASGLRTEGLPVGGAMGIDAARMPERDLPGWAVGSFANELNRVYFSSKSSLVFAEEALAGDDYAESTFQRFGLFFFDFDLDGRLDLLTANGYLEDQINRVQSMENYKRPADLYWNSGGRFENRFTPMTEEKAGSDLFQPILGRGAAYGDFDGDGDLDVVLTQNGGRPLLLRNDSALDRNWVRVKLEGRSSNRDGIAATVRLDVGTRVLSGTVMPTRSYLSQSELPLTIGLGRATRIRRMIVYWPNGDEQVVEDVPVNASVVVRQE